MIHARVNPTPPGNCWSNDAVPTHSRAPFVAACRSDSPTHTERASRAFSSIRDRLPSSFATHAVRPAATISLGTRSTPIATVPEIPRPVGSIRTTVAVLRLRTHTAPSLAAIDAGTGASSPGRSAIAIGSVTRLVAGSMRSTFRCGR